MSVTFSKPRLRAPRLSKQTGLFALVALGVALIVAGVLLVLPKTVEVSFAARTCTGEITLFPTLYKARDDKGFAVEYQNPVQIGSFELLSSEVCFRPTEAPTPGETRIATAPWGSIFVTQAYVLSVPSAPQLSAAPLEQPVPTTKSVTLPLSKPDTLHTYTLAVEKQSVACEGGSQELACAINQLKLKQGKAYDYAVTRQFASSPPSEVIAGQLKTLKAVTVTSSSIKSEQVVYSKPRHVDIAFDKPIKSAVATLKAGDNTLETEVAVDGDKARVTFAADLARDTAHTLTISDVEAADGSTLVEPYKLPFFVSGGPKVATISIDPNRVATNERVIVTFDQALSNSQAIESLVSVQGGAGTIARLNDTQIVIQLSGLGRCNPFSITVAAGVKSKYDVTSSTAWKYDSRTTCAAVSVYGNSVQGRPLVAYTFGTSGPVTLYTGAIHGNEISSKYLMDAWIAELEANPGKIGNRRIVVIPNINPDGVVAGTRNNSRNVNLSRNFPTDNWVSDINDTNGPLKGGGGKEPLSEPEAKALAAFTQALNPRLLLSFHAVGGFVVGDPAGPSVAKAAQYASLSGLGNYTGLPGTFDYDITGAYEDWTYRNVGIPSMVIELRSYSYVSLAQHRSALWAMLD